MTASVTDEKEFCQTLGKNVRKNRKKIHLSQEKLAGLVEISPNYLSNIENGKTWISVSTLVKLATVFGVEPHVLFDPRDVVEERKLIVAFEKVADDMALYIADQINSAYAAANR
jgi:transcriptional regulator with XRE-family HTH domain